MSEHWKIRVQGYGTFEFYGTEDEAEEARRNKSRWEGGIGIKWRSDLSRKSDKLTAQIAEKWDQRAGVSAKLIKARKKALAEEPQP